MAISGLNLMEARQADLADLLPLIRAYHEFEGVVMSDLQRAHAVAPLLVPDSAAGRLWLFRVDGQLVGYAALCFGYSIEFGGQDAFVDELFIAEPFRARGLGSSALESLIAEARVLGLSALHLEVACGNDRAQRLYERCGFRARDRFQLMSCELGPAADALPEPCTREEGDG